MQSGDKILPDLKPTLQFFLLNYRRSLKIMEEAEGGSKEKSFPMGKVDAARILGFPADSTNLEDLPREEWRRRARGTCLAVLDLVNHALIVGLTAYTLYLSWGSTVVNLHTIFCTIGVRIIISIDNKTFFKRIPSPGLRSSSLPDSVQFLPTPLPPSQKIAIRERKTGKRRTNRRNSQAKPENAQHKL